jgi:hypothetical protein
MAAIQIFASGAVAAEEEVTDEEGIVEVEDVVAEKDGVALDVEEEMTALELVTTEEVGVEVLALDEVINVLVTLEVVIKEELVTNEEVVVCDGLDKVVLEETIGREESTLDVIFSGEQLASNVNKITGMMCFIWINIFLPSLQSRALCHHKFEKYQIDQH